VPQSTIGYERIANWAWEEMSEDEFVARVLAGQPEPPRYFAQMKRVNREGPRILGSRRRPAQLPPERLHQLLQEGAQVIDTRSAETFAAGHVPGTINIPLDRSFSTWAGWLASYDRDLYLIIEDEVRLDEAVADLAMIGLDRIAGYFGSQVLNDWSTERVLATTPQISVEQLATDLRSGAVNVVDVRGATEWESGHLPAVPNIPLGSLQERLAEIPAGLPLVVHCQTGARSAIASSVLQAHGFRDVLNLTGGYEAWVRAGRPTESGAMMGLVR
jgi:hydroxyacylglutathione hydrolase